MHGNSLGSRREIPMASGPNSGGAQLYNYASSGLPVPVVTSHATNHHAPGSRD